MRKIGYMLITLLLISSCGKHDFINSSQEPQNRSKRDLSKQEETQKTPEEELKEKLSEEEKGNLNFLKEALGDDGKFGQFLSLDENKVKDALKHINDELAKCTGDNAGEQKGTFKTVVQGYFSDKMDESKLEQFKSQATSTCGAGAGG
ncbi:Mlp family lipoprotein (plasmid) [Borrelia miyamotoi]|uniref:Mlp family lipoprotein n=1 Tax=Borrelia miyamotoi TaxID=47466 RepID=A0A5P8ARN7_9SPIR|nr:Mlp family lipoprotein [Borrelia miyamotoi]QFP42616.1 Mlp family lipoprotein [Borrelia miyamotoi]WVI05564.1 Mlp family lipoprotein [Borrelia miyamotoi]